MHIKAYSKITSLIAINQPFKPLHVRPFFWLKNVLPCSGIFSALKGNFTSTCERTDPRQQQGCCCCCGISNLPNAAGSLRLQVWNSLLLVVTKAEGTCCKPPFKNHWRGSKNSDDCKPCRCQRDKYFPFFFQKWMAFLIRTKSGTEGFLRWKRCFYFIPDFWLLRGFG